MTIRLKKECARCDGKKIKKQNTYIIDIQTKNKEIKIGFIPHLISQYKKLRKVSGFMKALKNTVYWFCEYEVVGFYHYRILIFAIGWKNK